jgi:hypothetical protein
MRSAGYALVMALLLLVLASLAVTLAVQKAQTDARREREAELLFVGDEFLRAIRAYASAPGLPSRYPEKLADLLEDGRWPVPRRYLRRIYPDPMTGKADWDLDLVAGRIVGVHSRSGAAPLRHANFPAQYAVFANADSYRNWRFSMVGAPAGAAANGSGGSSDNSPSPPTPPDQAARIACVLQYGPSAAQQCGNDRACLVGVSRQYLACLAAIPPGG